MSHQSEAPGFLVRLAFQIPVLIALTVVFPTVSWPQTEAPNAVEILNAGVEATEDAPFVPSTYRFLPGEYIYCSFQISGFVVKTDEEKNSHRIALDYEVTATDLHDRPLAEPVRGDIGADLSPEDKNWLPKRRASFLLPSYISQGEYRLRISVHDKQGGGAHAVVKAFPFQVGGVHIQPSSNVLIENFRFTREEGGTEALEVPAYRPGDPVFGDFVFVGFACEANNHYHVSYSVNVTGPNGKPYLSEQNAANLEAVAFYPPQFLPGNFAVTTAKNSLPGQYVVTVTAHDLIGKRDFKSVQTFSLE
jgi:hypothetical protein